jgi:hypothetical protein
LISPRCKADRREQGRTKKANPADGAEKREREKETERGRKEDRKKWVRLGLS